MCQPDKNKSTKSDELFHTLNTMETELIHLEIISDVILKTELDTSICVYLSQRVADHTANIRKSFRQVWDMT